jgi:hypothetical protein
MEEPLVFKFQVGDFVVDNVADETFEKPKDAPALSPYL